MIGLVLATHGELGEAFIRSMKMIVGEQSQVEPLSLQLADNIQAAKGKLSRAVQKADSGDGVLILTDMLGGTPSNLCLSLLGRSQVEVVSGVNLPMLLKATLARKESGLRETANRVKKHARDSILVASEVLESGTRHEAPASRSQKNRERKRS